MTDKEYREQKKRVQKYIDKWLRTMGMGWFQIDFEWSRESDRKNPNTAARTTSSWQYKNAAIEFFLPEITRLSDDKLENIVVHEFCHVLLSPLAQNQDEDDKGLSDQVNEYTTELIANAVIWAREAGREDK